MCFLLRAPSEGNPFIQSSIQHVFVCLSKARATLAMIMGEERKRPGQKTGKVICFGAKTEVRKDDSKKI